jgi:hypothetical protein
VNGANWSQPAEWCLQVIEKLERETGVEPATSSLGSWHSTTELLPPFGIYLHLPHYKPLTLLEHCLYSLYCLSHTPCSEPKTDSKPDSTEPENPRSKTFSVPEHSRTTEFYHILSVYCLAHFLNAGGKGG